MSASATVIQTMDTVVADLWRRIRELRGDYAVLPDASATAIELAKAALEELEGDLRDAVLTDGGVHGSPEKAWSVWQDLAIDTGKNLQRAAGYADDYSLTGYILKAGETAVDAAENFKTGVETLVGLVVFGWIVVTALKVRR